MAVEQLNTERISATGSQFLVLNTSAGGVEGIVPYTKILGGIDLSATASVIIGNQIDASVHGQVSAFITNQIDVSAHGQVSAFITNQIDVSAHGQISAFITNQIDVSAHGQVSAHISNQVDVSAHGQVSAHISNTPNVIAAGDTQTLYAGTTALTPKFAKIGVNTNGAEVIVATVAAKKIRVLSMALVCEGAVGVYFSDSGGGNSICGDATNPMEFQAGGGVVLPYNPLGWFQGSSSSAISIVPDTQTSVAGCLTYVEV